jgi:regulator of RNase E activity RraA
VATLCTALFKRGLRNQFIQDVHPLNPGLPNMVGPAYTLRYMPAREDLNPMACSTTAATRSARRWRSARPARCS